MGGDTEEIEEHIKNHREYRTRRNRPNKEKSYASFNISNGDIEVDDSDRDENWEKTKEVEKLLEDDLEEDEFFYKCDVCNFETLFVDQFRQHKKWNHLKANGRLKWK